MILTTWRGARFFAVLLGALALWFSLQLCVKAAHDQSPQSADERAPQRPSALHAGSTQPAKCTLKIEQAPALRGFRLGMSLEQAAKAFPKISIPAADPYGVTQLRVIGKDLNGAALKSNFEGVTFASFSFLDKRLVSIHFSYDSKRSSWANLNEFITNVAASLNLPTGWRGSPDPSVEIQHLDCDGFTVSAGFVFDNESFIRLTDETAKEIVKKREEEERERKRGAEKEKIFKP